MAHINDTRRLHDLDPRFLDRYNLIGPRYTSYPTAPEWTEAVDAEAVEKHLLALKSETEKDHEGDYEHDYEHEHEHEHGRNLQSSICNHQSAIINLQSAIPLSLYFHVPFCFERCSFCGCNVIVSRRAERVADPYLELLEKEAELYAGLIDTRRPVVQLHWGGGTPTYLAPDQIRRAHAALTRRFRLAPGAEQSIEVHVTWTSDEQLRLLAELGFNRLSLGVQDFNERTMAAIGRRQTYERTREIIELARELGFTGINIDLIYGLPHQTPETFGETVDRILGLAPDRLAVYNFAYLPEKMPHQRAIEAAALPRGEEKFKIFLAAYERFREAGYRYIGMDHFARPGDELARAFDEGTMQRNFMGFTTRAGADMIGLGVSSIGFIGGMYAQNVKKLTQYREALEAGRLPIERGMLLSRDDLIRREVIGGLMCRDRVSKREIEAKFGIGFDEYFHDELECLARMIGDELLSVNEEALELTFLGRLFVRNIAMVFDAYLTRARRQGRQRMFSRTL